MKKELQDEIYRKYPLLYSNKDKSMRESCMHWGLEVDDGWYQLIDELSSKLEGLILKQLAELEDKNVHARASQVKEKYATLRFYMDYSTDEMEELITKAEHLSAKVCESCGKEGVLRSRGSWFITSCEACCTGRREGFTPVKGMVDGDEE
jgi:hypothetical protein